MGARIAAHLANAGVPLLAAGYRPAELTPTKSPAAWRSPTRACAIASCAPGWKPRSNRAPPHFSRQQTAARITIGNFEDNLAWCAEADWIIEAVAENLEIKRKLLERVAAHRRPGTIVTTNTSGLPIRADRRQSLRGISSSIGPARISSTRRDT